VRKINVSFNKPAVSDGELTMIYKLKSQAAADVIMLEQIPDVVWSV
jgi:hypothetical protein